MTFYEKVGNITVYTEHFTPDNSIEVSFLNGSDLIARETYFNTTSGKAVADLFSKVLDTYTEEWLHLNFTMELVKISYNTYRISDNDYFCRVDDTTYFKHFRKSADEFITDKNGLRIIDR